MGLGKIEYKNKNIDLNDLYITDPHTFLIYNIVDSLLCLKLNNNLKHIELYNDIRRIMKTPISYSMSGSSVLFDTFVFYKLMEENKFVRCGINNEQSRSIESTEFIQTQFMKDKKGVVIPPPKITNNIFSHAISSFPGAYVQLPTPQIINDGSIIIDLDASLPPWEKIYIRNQNGIFWGEIGDYQWQEGDETLTWNKDNETCWNKIKGKIEHVWDGELITFTTETGKKVCVTSNHSIFAIEKKVKTDTPYLVDAGKLEIGDYIVGYINFEPGVNKKLIYPELIGFWLSDGWVSRNKKYFYIAKQDPELLEIFSPHITKIRIKRLVSEFYKEEWIGQITDPLIKLELLKFYIHTTRKNFFEILNYDRDNRRRIWDGMFFADGTLHGLNMDSVSTPTERLCKYRYEELVECFLSAHTITWRPKLTQNGIDNVPIRTNDKSHRYGPTLVIPEVYSSKKGYTKYLALLKLSANHRHPYEKLLPLFPYITNSYSKYIGLEKIIKIEKQQYSGPVYDISVEETERFFAGTGIGVHNSALYPSTILQSNISFDSYCGRIIPVCTYKVLELLEQYIGKTKLPPQIYSNIQTLVTNYIDRVSVDKKKEKSAIYYYIILYLFNKLQTSNIPMDQIYNPVTTTGSLLLKNTLMPLIDLLNLIHPDNPKYNKFIYDYYFLEDINELFKMYPIIYILNNPGESNSFISKCDIKTGIKQIKNYISTLAGTLFLKHEVRTGLFANFLINMGNMRKEYKNKRDINKNDPYLYNLNDNRQKSVKIIMNTTTI